jgi:hypothetical protein
MVSANPHVNAASVRFTTLSTRIITCLKLKPRVPEGPVQRSS